MKESTKYFNSSSGRERITTWTNRVINRYNKIDLRDSKNLAINRDFENSFIKFQKILDDIGNMGDRGDYEDTLIYLINQNEKLYGEKVIIDLYNNIVLKNVSIKPSEKIEERLEKKELKDFIKEEKKDLKENKITGTLDGKLEKGNIKIGFDNGKFKYNLVDNANRKLIPSEKTKKIIDNVKEANKDL